jgi:uncharacterized integral membrane protein
MSFQFEGGDPTGGPASGRGAGSAADSGGRKVGLLVAWGILAVVGLAFVVQNHDQVAFEFLFFDFRWPLWIMLVVFFLLGLLTGLIVAWRRRSSS